MSSPDTTPSDCYPSIFYDDAATMIDWLCTAFGFQKRCVFLEPDGRVMHSELSFGTAVIMVGSANPEKGFLSMAGLKGSTCVLSLYVVDPDTHYATAMAAGATIVRELRDEDYGARGYMVQDPEGHQWCFADYRPGAFWDGKGG